MTSADRAAGKLVEALLRLGRLAPHLDPAGRSELAPLVTLLQELAPPTVTRSEAARLLGVSHTSVNRWIDQGEIPTVLTPRGRPAIPLLPLVELVKRVEEDRDESPNLALARTIRARRHGLEQVEVDALLPRGYRGASGHRKPELRSLAYHRIVADRLDEHVVENAKSRLKRWQRQGKMHPRWAAEWEEILEKPHDQIADVLSADTEHASALRQSSPFSGVLTEHERRSLLQRVEEAIT